MKKELRQQVRKVIQSISRVDLLARSGEVCRRLMETPEYAKSESLMIYLPAGPEVDTTPLVLDAWHQRKRVMAPRVIWGERRMLPIEIHTLHQDLAESPIGLLREPIGGGAVSVAEIDMVILPGVAFDADGNRLGRGSGFYDRFLTHRDYRAVSCALALEEQIIQDVPTEPLDRGVDMLVTDREVRRFKLAASR